MQRVVVTVSTRGPIHAGGTHPGWTVSYAARVGGADQPIGAERDMPATAYRLALPSGPPRSVVVPTPAERPGGPRGGHRPGGRRRPSGRRPGEYGGWLLDALFGPLWPDIEAAADPGAGLELALSWSHDDHTCRPSSGRRCTLRRCPGRTRTARPQPSPLWPASRPLVAFTPSSPGRAATGRAAGPAGDHGSRVLFALGADPLDPEVRPGAMFLGLLRSFEAEGTCVSRVVTAVGAEDLDESCRALPARHRPPGGARGARLRGRGRAGSQR